MTTAMPVIPPFNSECDEYTTQPRSVLPDPSKFDGDRHKFLGWFLEMEAKLVTDGRAFGSHKAQFHYIYIRLGDIP